MLTRSVASSPTHSFTHSLAHSITLCFDVLLMLRRLLVARPVRSHYIGAAAALVALNVVGVLFLPVCNWRRWRRRRRRRRRSRKLRKPVTAAKCCCCAVAAMQRGEAPRGQAVGNHGGWAQAASRTTSVKCRARHMQRDEHMCLKTNGVMMSTKARMESGCNRKQTQGQKVHWPLASEHPRRLRRHRRQKMWRPKGLQCTSKLSEHA